MLYAFCTFVTYEALDTYWWDRRLRPLELVVQSAAVSSLVITFTFPFDLVRKRMQVLPVCTCVYSEPIFMQTCIFFWFILKACHFSGFFTLENLFTHVVIKNGHLNIVKRWPRSTSINSGFFIFIKGKIMFKFMYVRFGRFFFQAKSSSLPCNGGVGINFSNARTCVLNTVQSSGIRGLWKGLLPTIVRVGSLWEDQLVYPVYTLVCRLCFDIEDLHGLTTCI